MKFGYDIRDIKVVDNQVIVLLSIPFHTNEIDNIYAVSLDCKINWRVESLNIRLFYPSICKIYKISSSIKIGCC